MARNSFLPTCHRGVAASALLLLTLASGIVRGAPGDTELVSVALDGSAAGFADQAQTAGPAVSADGRYVAFVSGATNLVTNDTNGFSDTFVRDRLNGTIELVSVATGGTPANDSSGLPAISPDGRFVAFTSLASNLVTGDTNEDYDVFVHDRQTGQTQRVNVSSGGAQANRISLTAAISGDGRFVAFLSQATNLVPNDTNNKSDVFVRDRQAGTTERVTLTSTGTQTSGFTTNPPSLSRDGRFVAFASDAPNLVANDTNGVNDVFVRDRLNGVTERVSVNSAGNQATEPSIQPSISADGRYVAFISSATNLVPGDSNTFLDVFVRDRATGQTAKVSVDSNGLSGNAQSFEPSISGDGRYVAFSSEATNLVARDSNALVDVFLRDTVDMTTSRASVASDGAQANGHSMVPATSANGLYVVFASEARNLASNDSNRTADVYLHERGGTLPGTEKMSYSLLPKAMAFGEHTVFTYRLRRFKLENTGNVPLPITSVSVVGPDRASFKATSGCGTSVGVGVTCVIDLLFRPTTVGDKTATLRVVAGDNDVRTRPLSGTGVPGVFSVSPTSLAFGRVAVGSSSDLKTVTITNTGRASLPIESISLDGGRPGQFRRFDSCGTGLAAGNSCTVSVAFNPKLSGPLSASLVVTAGGGTSPKSVQLTGTGVP